MNFRFPTFSKGSASTLLDSENAQQVKKFIEAFNSVKIQVGNQPGLIISEKGVIITISRDDLKKVVGDYMEATYTIRTLDVCDEGDAISYDFVTAKSE